MFVLNVNSFESIASALTVLRFTSAFWFFFFFVAVCSSFYQDTKWKLIRLSFAKSNGICNSLPRISFSSTVDCPSSMNWTFEINPLIYSNSISKMTIIIQISKWLQIIPLLELILFKLIRWLIKDFRWIKSVQFGS